MRPELQEKIDKIKETVGKRSIHINRVPEKTKEFFTELAKKEFEDDYGWTLKKLVDVYQGLYPSGNEEIEAKIELLANEIAEIKQKLEKPKRKIKTVSGREIGGKEDE